MENSESDVKAELVDMIIDLQLNLNISKGMDEEQCIKAANFLFKEYKEITLEDFALVFSSGIKGLYGPIFDRLDVAVICEWVGKHLGLKKDFKYKGPDLGITPEQLAGLKKWQQNKVIEPATTSDILKAKGMPEDVKAGLTSMFKKLGIKEPFKKEDKKDQVYEWPKPADDFENGCIEVFKENWKSQGEPLLKNQNKPYIIFDEIMYNPDNWLTFCYKMKMDQEQLLTKEETQKETLK